MLKNFVIRKVLESQMKDVPQADREKIFQILEKDPDFFMKLATDVDAKIKSGKDKTTAMTEVMNENLAKLRELTGNITPSS